MRSATENRGQALRRDGEKKGFKEVFEGEITAEIEALIGPGAADRIDFEAIEIAARREVLKIAARAIEQRLNQDESDHSGPVVACSCGNQARYAGRHAKTVKTALGEMTLRRAYYHCASCASGWFPRDGILGIAHSSMSPAITRMIGLAGAMVSFEESSELLAELAGVRIDSKQIERTAESLGREIDAYERGVLVSSAPWAPTMYLGLDGTGIPMRGSELEGRAGKQSDGSSKTREVKLVTIWTAEGRDDEGNPVRDPGSVSYSAAIESAASSDMRDQLSEFAQRVDREAKRRGLDHAPRRVALADGSLWIWSIVEEQFPGAIQILDLYHAKQHLSDVAKEIYGASSDLARQWAAQRNDELDDGETGKVLDALAAHKGTNESARKCFDYVTNNRDRMNYPDFRAKGLSVGSGVVEAGCKLVVGTRLKRSGMHWSVAGANAIISLRSCKLSARFEDFWEARSPRFTHRET